MARGQGEEGAKKDSKISKILKLALAIFALWFFFAVFTPWLEARFPAWQAFNRAQEENGLHSGAVYYTDVPITQEAEAHVREAVAEGMKEWRRKR